jgi:hypothetical protein
MVVDLPSLEMVQRKEGSKSKYNVSAFCKSIGLAAFFPRFAKEIILHDFAILDPGPAFSIRDSRPFRYPRDTMRFDEEMQ